MTALPAEVSAAIDARVISQIAAARRRREARDAWQAAHVERRRYGNAARHRAKFARLGVTGSSQTSREDRP